MASEDIVIVGAGLAGLCCALHLQGRGVSCTVLEASDEVGGRVRTDKVAGFLLDRGFQVFLPAYPEAKRILNYEQLKLRPFYPGALIRFDHKTHRIADPWNKPIDAMLSLFNSVVPISDQLAIRKLRANAMAGSLDELWAKREVTALEQLSEAGISSVAIDRFFRPWLGGVFLEKELTTSSRMLEFIIRMFALKGAAVPAEGMQAIPRQIADKLAPGTIRFGQRVEAINPSGLKLVSGEQVRASTVILAVEGKEAHRLAELDRTTTSLGVTTIYFAAERPPVKESILVLNGDGIGPVNNVAVMSNLSSAYAPPGQALVAVTVLGCPENIDLLHDDVLRQMSLWFGPNVSFWRPIRTYRIAHALPGQPVGWLEPATRGSRVRMRPRVFCCGDHRTNASIDGAMTSGRQAAEMVLMRK